MDDRGASQDFQWDRNYYETWKDARQAMIESPRYGLIPPADPEPEPTRHYFQRHWWPFCLTVALLIFVAGIWLGAHIPKVLP